MWGDEYQVLVATHFNTGTYHNHFVVNSVGLWDGKKFNCGKRTYFQFHRLSDEFCKEYQLSTIKNPKGKTPRSIYFAEKNGEPTKYNLMREAIDAALKDSVDGNDLRKAFREQGYELDANPAHKYATLKTNIPEMEAELETTENSSAGLQRFIDRAKRITRLTELTPEIIHEFIEKIVVSKSEKKNGKRYQTVDIYYNTIGLWCAPSPEEMETLFQSYQAKHKEKTA